MSTSIPIRIGQNGPSGQFDDLFLPVFGGEILASFEEQALGKNLVRYMQMEKGNEMKFPMIHKLTAERHAAGTELGSLDTEMGERTIRLDERPLVSYYALDDVDEKMAHYEVRSELAKQAARALAREQDIQTLQLIAKASGESANGQFDGGGYKADKTQQLDGTSYVVTNSGGANDDGNLPANPNDKWEKTHAVTLMNALGDIQTAWDERDVPREDRYCVVPWSCWHELRNLGVPDSYTGNTSTVVGYPGFNGGSGIQPIPGGGVKNLDTLEFNTIKIVASNYLPTTNVTTGELKYQGNYTNLRALCVQKEAVGLLTLMGIQVETGRDFRKLQDFFVARMLGGGGTLRPECAVRIDVA